MSSSDESGDESDIEGDMSYTSNRTPPEPVVDPPVPPRPVIASPQPIKPPGSPSFLPRVFTPRLPRLTPHNNVASTSTDSATPAPPVDYLTAKSRTPSRSPARSRSATPGHRVIRPRFRSRKETDYSFSTGNDILGIVMLEIARAEDLPKLKNSASYMRSLLIDSLTRSCSHAHWLGYGPICRRLVRQKSLPHSCHPTFPQPTLGRKAAIPCPEVRSIL